MLLEILDTDVADSALHHLHDWQRIWLLTPPQFPYPVQIFLPVDAVDILEMSVDSVPVIFDHLPADFTLEWLALRLTATILVLVVSVADVVLVLNVTIEGAIVIKHLRTQSTGEQAG